MSFSVPRNAGTSHRPTVLIADDEPALLLVLERYLTRAGFSVLCASNIQDALALLDHWSISAVVVDILLGSSDGMTLAEAVHKWHRGLSVIAISGSLEACEAARAAGMPCIEKGRPGSLSELVSALRAALGLGHHA